MVTEILHFERNRDSSIAHLSREDSWKLLKEHGLVEGEMPEDQFEYYTLNEGVRVRDLDLRRVYLARAVIQNVHFGNCQLDGADLRHTVLANCSLVGTSVMGANLGGAQLLGTLCIGLKYNSGQHTEHRFAGNLLFDTLPFLERHVKGRCRLWHWVASLIARFCHIADKDPRKRKTIVHNLHVRDSRNPLFERYVADENYLTAFKDTPRHFYPYLLWKVTCNCGRSFVLWLLWSLTISGLFGFAYWLFPHLIHVECPPGRIVSFMTYVYYSIVTFTTLGFGDIMPLSPIGELLVVIEVFIGYMMLGGLISIFANRLSRRA